MRYLKRRSVAAFLGEMCFDWLWRLFLGVVRISDSMAVRDARWKLIQTYEPNNSRRVAFTELYDLQHDPDEMRNLTDNPEHAPRIDRMIQLITEHDRKIRRSGEENR